MSSAAVILITGGTGLIGNALSKALVQNGYRVIILTRDTDTKRKKEPGISYASWDVEKQYIDAEAIQQADHIVHLAGEGIADKRWTEKRKKEIQESRVKSGELLVKYLRGTTHKVKTFISASAIGWYGSDPQIPNQHPFKETDVADESFLGQTCRLWEQSVDPVAEMGIRLVKFRTGIVLSNKGGAIKEFQKPIRFGIAGILGNGKQVCSWIHIDDLIYMYMFALQHEKLGGVYNAVALHPVNNKELTLQLAKHMKGSFYVPVYVPAFVLRIFVGEMSEEVLKSATVSANKIKAAGFTYQFPYISSAIKHL